MRRLSARPKGVSFPVTSLVGFTSSCASRREAIARVRAINGACIEWIALRWMGPARR